MVPIHTHPPSREYDEGWDRIFGKKKEDHVHELGSCSFCDRRERLKELTQLTEEFGGYDTERETTPSEPPPTQPTPASDPPNAPER